MERRRRRPTEMVPSPSALSALRYVSAVSGAYDFFVGVFILFATATMAAWFGVTPPIPEIMADLNGVFLLAVGVGYALPWKDPVRYRDYLWVMGPLLKGAGAALFLYDFFVRGGPASFLLFAASDGTLALVTLWALLRSR
jgi:hypothetical protein